MAIAVRAGPLGLLREVFPKPGQLPQKSVSTISYRRTIEDILADTTVLGPTGCLEYRHHGSTGGFIDNKGYGTTQYQGKTWRTHRLVALYVQVKHLGWRDWLASQSWIFVCHTCDNPPCINPDHLVIATAQYNTLDALAKGRLQDRDKSLAKAVEEFRHDLERVAQLDLEGLDIQEPKHRPTRQHSHHKSKAVSSRRSQRLAALVDQTYPLAI